MCYKNAELNSRRTLVPEAFFSFVLHIFTFLLLLLYFFSACIYCKAPERKPLVQSAGKLIFYQQDIDGNSDWLDEIDVQTRLAEFNNLGKRRSYNPCKMFAVKPP